MIYTRGVSETLRNIPPQENEPNKCETSGLNDICSFRRVKVFDRFCLWARDHLETSRCECRRKSKYLPPRLSQHYIIYVYYYLRDSSFGFRSSKNIWTRKYIS